MTQNEAKILRINILHVQNVKNWVIFKLTGWAELSVSLYVSKMVVLKSDSKKNQKFDFRKTFIGIFFGIKNHFYT